MDGWHRRFARAAHRVERWGERAQARFAPVPARGWVEPYAGFGTADRALVRGRVFSGAPIPPAGERDRGWTNLRNTLRRLESDEIPGARVRVHFAGGTAEALTNEEGFWETWIRPALPFPADRLWHRGAVELLAPVAAPPVTAELLVPTLRSRLAVISDLDDTVIRTDATRALRMARTVFLGNARTRLPFPGVGAFYRALQGEPGQRRNPIFYVSSSPWNFHDLLSEFLKLRGIPRGPLFLRDWGVTAEEVFPTGHARHKLAAIRRVMELFPALPFLLIGDSGQEDPEIYHRVVHDFPRRILAVYIRNVQPLPARAAQIRILGRETQRAGVPLVLADDTLGLARHAARQGWIDPGAPTRVADDEGARSAAADPAAAARANRALSTRPGV